MDCDSLSQGFAFRLIDIPDSLPLDSVSEDGLLFSLTDKDWKTSLAPLPDKRFEHDLYIPPLEAEDGARLDDIDRVESEDASSPSLTTAVEPAELNGHIDFWALDFGADDVSALPTLKTWEAFGKPAATDDFPLLLSEAGPDAFDVAVSRIESTEPSSGVLPQDVMLRSLCNLVVGHGSLFYQWNSSKRTFEPTLPEIPTSGLTVTCHESFVATLVEFGSHFRRLVEYSTNASAERTCPALVSFRACVAGVLHSIETYITRKTGSVRSVLQLQNLVVRPRRLLDLLGRLLESVRACKTDDDVISKLSDHISDTVDVSDEFVDVSQEILARVSRPWLQALCEDLGLAVSANGLSMSQSDSLIGSEVGDEAFSELEDPQPKDLFPSFVQEDDRTLIRRTRATLKMLRHHAKIADCTSLNTEGASGSQLPMLHITTGDVVRAAEDPTSLPLGALGWEDDTFQEAYLTSLAKRMSERPYTPKEDELENATLAALDRIHHHTNDSNLILLTTGPYDPLARIRPLLRSHAHTVNTAILRHLFHDCRLLDHLDLLRQYFLLGNGDFVDRLSTALFSSDAGSAERQRGAVPTAGTVGLRLAARDELRWPPAASEVQLSLMGLLAPPSSSSSTRSDHSTSLLSELSFSIRELSEEEIERVSDPRSIHALDFLKLQYASQAPLDAVLTPQSLRAYDAAFRFLLQLLRMVHVTSSLRRKCTVSPESSVEERHDGRERLQAAQRFANEARHCVSVMMAHFMEMGIGVPFRALLPFIHGVEDAVRSERSDSATFEHRLSLGGVEELRLQHQICMERIRSRLLLRRKSGKLRRAVEAVFAVILEGVAMMEKDSTADVTGLEGDLQQAVRSLITALRASVERSSKNASQNDYEAEEDVDALRLLLMRLDWNNFYGGSDG